LLSASAFLTIISRWYGPTQALFDKPWKLPDIEEMK